MEFNGLLSEKNRPKHLDILVDFLEDAHNPRVYCQDNLDPAHGKKEASPGAAYPWDNLKIYEHETVSIYTRGPKGGVDQPSSISAEGKGSRLLYPIGDNPKPNSGFLSDHNTAQTQKPLPGELKDVSFKDTNLGESGKDQGLPHCDFVVGDLNQHETSTPAAKLVITMHSPFSVKPSEDLYFDVLPGKRQ